TGVAFATEDVIAPAKIAFDGIVKFKKMTVKAACVEGKIYSTDEAKVLASIPSREVLVAQLLGMLTMPIRGLAIALDQIANKKA
ncbi:MAG: 50S ribosomal protein L10, partial [Clostridia bacterium]